MKKIKFAFVLIVFSLSIQSSFSKPSWFEMYQSNYTIVRTESISSDNGRTWHVLESTTFHLNRKSSSEVIIVTKPNNSCQLVNNKTSVLDNEVLEYINSQNILEIRIFDFLGREVSNISNVTNFSLGMLKLEKGFYFIQMKFENSEKRSFQLVVD